MLMVAWMNEESFARTMESGETWFWSRSREELWHKGATSGNRQKVIAMATDCDRDTILVDVEPAGPACHTGAWSCFGDEPWRDRPRRAAGPREGAQGRTRLRGRTRRSCSRAASTGS
jgi:phosphoribosyl-AMP cyclohydrolase